MYPDYINAVKTVAQGRRIPKDKGTARQAGKLEARESDPLLNQICRLRQASSAPREGTACLSALHFLHTGNQLKTDNVTHHPVDVCPFVEQPFCCLQVTPLGSIVQAGMDSNAGCGRVRETRQSMAQHSTLSASCRLEIRLKCRLPVTQTKMQAAGKGPG